MAHLPSYASAGRRGESRLATPYANGPQRALAFVEGAGGIEGGVIGLAAVRRRLAGQKNRRKAAFQFERHVVRHGEAARCRRYQRRRDDVLDGEQRE